MSTHNEDVELAIRELWDVVLAAKRRGMSWDRDGMVFKLREMSLPMRNMVDAHDDIDAIMKEYPTLSRAEARAVFAVRGHA